MKSLIAKIKEKKELSGIADSVVETEITSYLKKKRITLPQTKKSEKIIVKEVRALLRRYVGQYQRQIKKRVNHDPEQLLQTHISTKERLEDYDFIKQLLKKHHVRSILDLGCGLNPLALATQGVTYYASDINAGELDIISDFFKKHKIKGRTFVHDIRNPPQLLPKADICLILKVLDLIDYNKYEITQQLLDTLPCKVCLISFSTKKLSGRSMKQPQRDWFIQMLQKSGYEYETFEGKYETYYLVYLSARRDTEESSDS